jgi:DNA-binding GntR family transcriptional regulator
MQKALDSTDAVPPARRSGRAVSRQVLADHVYTELLTSLMDGRLAPGSAVSIDGTKWTPVRLLGPDG